MQNRASLKGWPFLIFSSAHTTSMDSLSSPTILMPTLPFTMMAVYAPPGPRLVNYIAYHGLVNLLNSVTVEPLESDTSYDPPSPPVEVYAPGPSPAPAIYFAAFAFQALSLLTLWLAPPPPVVGWAGYWDT